MITVTITVAALAATSILGYYIYHYKNEADSANAKFKAIKQFADEAGAKILKLEAANITLSNHVITLRSKLEVINAKSDIKQAAVMTDSATKVSVDAPIAKSKPRRRYKNKNKAKDTNQI